MLPRKNVRVYIAGPYSKGYLVYNLRTVLDAADELRELGFTPYVPHLTFFWDFLNPHPYEYWTELDNDWLEACHALLRLPGESPGADGEVELARRLGLPVYFSMDELAAAFV